jgi:hypothetical protein
MTIDHRIITGAHVEAEDLPATLAVTESRWQHVLGFHHVEVWLDDERLTVVSPALAALGGTSLTPINPRASAAAMQRSVAARHRPVNIADRDSTRYLPA